MWVDIKGVVYGKANCWDWGITEETNRGNDEAF